MKIFISWSGKTSYAIAAAVNEFLPRVIQAVKPFFSPEMEKGIRWNDNLDAALEGTSFGIACLTPDNLESKWLHYEVGALSKTPDAFIWTFLFHLKYSDVPLPLARFNHTLAEQKEDVRKLVKTINNRLLEPVEQNVLSDSFEQNWISLEEELERIRLLYQQKIDAKSEIGVNPLRTDRDILQEILETVRDVSQGSYSPFSSSLHEGSSRILFYGVEFDAPQDVLEKFGLNVDFQNDAVGIRRLPSGGGAAFFRARISFTANKTEDEADSYIKELSQKMDYRISSYILKSRTFPFEITRSM